MGRKEVMATKPIMICGVDDSRVSLAAAKVAAALAELLDHELELVHVVEDPPTFPYRDARLREHLRRDAIKDAMPLGSAHGGRSSG
jgi:nucleotide-binding universal stress UspA family protein